MGELSQKPTTTEEHNMSDQLVFQVHGQLFSHSKFEGIFTHAAVDADGTLFIYKERPTLNARLDEADQKAYSGIRFLRIRGGFLLPTGDWRSSVRHITYAE